MNTARAKVDKKRAILDAALLHFSQRGFHGTRIPQIAESAKVGAGTIYRYFKNKEALVNEVYRERKNLMMEGLLQAFPFDQSPREQFRKFWTELATFAREQPRTVIFMELHHHAPYLDQQSLQLEMQWLQPIVAFFENASEQGFTKELPAPLLIALVWGSLIGLVKACFLGHLELTDQVISAAEACAWDAVQQHPQQIN